MSEGTFLCCLSFVRGQETFGNGMPPKGGTKPLAGTQAGYLERRGSIFTNYQAS